MKSTIGKIMLSDRYTIIISAITVLAAIFTLIMYISIKSLEKENKSLTSQFKEIQILSEDFIHIRTTVESKEKKIGLTKVTGVVPTLEQLLTSLRVKAKVIKPLEKKMIKEFKEEDAELEIEDIDLNTIVNLLYKIENSPFLIKIKNANIKTTFEDPNRFILTLTTSLISLPR